MPMNREEFAIFLSEKGIVLSPKQLDQFDKYFHMLVEWNDKMNLTTILEEKEVYEKHFYDSLTIAFAFKFNDQSVLDIGTGAGFPAIPLKIVYPNLKLTVMDSVAKKLTFIKAVVDELELTDVTIVADRAENYIAKKREQFDVVTARAVAQLNVLMELAVPYVKKDGFFIALKGAKGMEEYHQARKASEILGVQLFDHQEIELPGENGTRHNLFYKKEKNTPMKYPRNYSQIKNRHL